MRATETFTVPVEIAIREIVEDDLAGLHDWYGPGRDASFRESFHRHRDGEIVYLVAITQGRPIGHLGAVLPKTAGGSGELWQLGVHPILQGRGIGTRLIEAGERILRERGIASAEIGVTKDNPGAKRLYERLGYRVTGESVDRWSYTDADGRRVEVAEDTWDLRKVL